MGRRRRRVYRRRPLVHRRAVIRRPIRRRRGGAFWDTLKKVGSFVKDNKLISRGLNMINPSYGATASRFGLGRRRRRRVYRRRRY